MNPYQHPDTANSKKRAQAAQVSGPFAVLAAVLTGLLTGGMVLI